MTEFELFQRVGLSIAIGLLIGIERGWHERDLAEGHRVAGIRTFGLIGLAGGILALLTAGSTIGFSLGFAGFSALIVASHVIARRQIGDVGATTSVASLLTFLLGGLAVGGPMPLAAAAAVVTALLLGSKMALHGWLRRIEHIELMAGLKLLLVSVVMLPVLPNRGLGPWAALNPYEIWWMVVLVAGISLVGYVAVRLAGPDRGLLLTGLLGGLSSSTAVTISFARLSRENPAAGPLLAAGAAAASAMMLPRVLIIIGLIQPTVLQTLLWPFLAAAIAIFAAVGFLWRWAVGHALQTTVDIRNPFEFWSAVRFGLLLAAVMVLARALPAWLGTPGYDLLALASGIGDVDAITLSMTRLANTEVTAETAARAIAIAVAANSGTKMAIAFASGTWPMAGAFAAAMAGGLSVGALVWLAAGLG
jgi:uncharacterized membrane protein (DUF4010 family)